MMIRIGLIWLVLLAGNLLLWSEGESPLLEESIRAGRESLESHADLPWYDADEDRVRQIDLPEDVDDANRHSTWAATEQPAESATADSSGAGRWVGTLVEGLAWLAIGSLFALLTWAILRAAMRSEFSRGGSGTSGVREPPGPNSRIEDLPVPISPQHQDLLSTARAYRAAGDLAQAIIYVFAHQLVELDKHHLIRLSRGKTNRQYLTELNKHTAFRELIVPTMVAFEETFFGHHPLSQQRFQACWDDLDRFHQQLQRVAP